MTTKVIITNPDGPNDVKVGMWKFSREGERFTDWSLQAILCKGDEVEIYLDDEASLTIQEIE